MYIDSIDASLGGTMHRIIILGLAGLAVSGCALPPVVIAISYATDGVLLATTGKTKTDHLISASAHQDCSTFRVVQGKEICHDWKDGKNPYLDVKDDSPNLAAGNEVGVPMYQATLNNDPLKRRTAQSDADKIAAAKNAEPKVVEPKVVEPKVVEPKVVEPKAAEPKIAEPKITEPKVADTNAVTVKTAPPVVAADKKISTVPVAAPQSGGPPKIVTTDPTISDTLVPVPSSDVSEVVDRSNVGAAPAAKKPAATKKSGPNMSKAPAAASSNAVAANTNDTQDYVVLLGSFRSEANARRAARLHRDLKPSVASADVQGQNYWRVASGPYSADRAQEIAQRLRDGGLHDALVVRDAGKANQAGVATRNGSQVAALR